MSTATSYTSNIGNIIATRIASLWNFTGPAFSVTQGCNSVFRALDLAKMLLESGEVDAAVDSLEHQFAIMLTVRGGASATSAEPAAPEPVT